MSLGDALGGVFPSDRFFNFVCCFAILEILLLTVDGSFRYLLFLFLSLFVTPLKLRIVYINIGFNLTIKIYH